MNKHMKFNKLAQGVTLGLLLGMTGMAYAAPVSTALPSVDNANVLGTNTVTNGGTIAAPVMTVTQDTTKATAQINWKTFNIGSAATVNFKQASSGSTMINNVVGNSMSEIAGKMNASGNIVLINPNGSTFYNGATINVGGLAVYAAKQTTVGVVPDLTDAANLINESSITMQDGVTINAGISTALAQAKAMGMNMDDYAIGINQFANRIRLVANGNVNLGSVTLNANDTTYTDNSQSSLGEEGYSTTESSNEMYGQVAIRADANANDYGQVTVNGTPVLTTQESRIYSNPDLAVVNTTADGVQYNRKNYNSMPVTDAKFSMTKGTHVTVTAKSDDTGTTILADKDAGGTAGKYVTTVNSGTGTANVRMLINNIAQLQDIDPNTTNNNGGNTSYGNLAGKYAMGKTIDATNDTATYLKDGILYTQDKTTGKIVGVAVADNSVFTSATSKTLADGTTTIDYDNVNNKVTTGNYAYTSTGTFSKTDNGKTYTTNTGDTQSTYNDGTNTYTKDTTAGTTSYTSGTNTFASNGTSTTLNNGTNTFTKTGTTTSYNNGTYDIAQTSGTTSYTASGTTYSQTGTTTQYVSGSDTYSLTGTTGYASLKNASGTFTTTDGNTLLLDGTAYAGTDAATILSNLNTATTSLTAAAGVLTPAATALSNAATTITTADGNITTANTNIATFLADADNTTARTELGTAYTQFTTSTAALSTEGVGTKSLSIINSANWDSKKGFDPIGSTTAPFTGSLDGYGGDTGHPVNNLTIMRGGTNGTDGEDNVGLFGVISGGSVGSFTLGGPKIQGQNNVGGIAGQLIAGGTISWSSVTGPGQKGVEDYTNAADTGYVATTRTGSGARENIGAVAGYVESSTITHVSNSATVIGQTNDGTVNVSNVGGIAGKVVNDPSATSAAISRVTNGGNVFGEKAVGGLVGYGEAMSIGATAGKTDLAAASYNNGQVTGQDETGGIMGHASGVTLKYVFNTNEDTPLSKNSMYYIDASGNIIKQGGTAGTTLAGNALNSTAALSKYGQVTGGTNTGGMVGYMENYSATKKSSIDTAYNAGNVTATGANTGGIVGQMTGGTITNAYNGDNNTVIKSDKTTTGEKLVPTAVSGHAVWTVTVGSENKTFAYDEFSAKYYGFYTADGTVYYFIPTNGTTTKGAGGIYVNAAGDIIDVNNSKSTQYVKESDRFYFNRLAYKDANVTGTENVGGVIGNISGGDISIVYDVGTVKSTTGATSTGGLIGVASAGTLTDSFYITGSDTSLMKKVYSNQTKAIGSGTVTTTTGVAAGGRTLAEMESRDTIKATYTNDDWLGSITKVDTDTGRTVYSYNGTADAIQWDGKEKIFSGASDTVLYYRPTIAGVQQTYYLKTGDETATQYTFSTDTSGNITLAAGGTTITYTAEKVSSNQGTNWIVYEQQTLPLLKYYMTDIGLTRVFEYDGSTHNLKTDDVDNLYGRADFADGSGQVVYKANEAESTLYPGSSEYYYDNSSNWSPQHGYIMNAMASVTITPKALDVVITGERTYGDVNNTEGYYLCVPYKDGENQKYAFYTVTGSGETTAYSLLSTTAQLDAFFGTYAQTEDGLKAKALADGHYVVTLNGIIDTEATSIDKAVKSAVTAVGNNTSGQSLNGIFSFNVEGGDQRLAATTTDHKYTIDSTNVSGLVAQNNDYTLTYSGSLLVDKANLYYTYDGERNYGAANSTGNHTYTLVGNETDSTGTTINGYLKSFDAGKLNIGTGNVLTDGVGATSYDMTGVVNANNANITAKGTQAITASTAGSYYQVMVDSSGNVIGYVLKTLDNGSTLSLTGKTADDTTALNNNYNLIWAAGGAIANVRKTTSSGVTTTSITANDSTQKIDPVKLTVTIYGQRNYGGTMDKTKYGTSTGSPGTTSGLYYVDINKTQMQAGDTTAAILGSNSSNAKIVSLIAGIEGTYGDGTTKINSHSNAGTYYISTGKSDAADSDITVTTKDVNGHYNILADNNYNYIVLDGNHKEVINKINATITTTAHREYGDTPAIGTTTTVDSFAGSGFTTWDQATFDANKTSGSNYQGGLTDTTAASTHAGIYTNQGYITENTTMKGTLTTDFGTNYNISYADTYQINQAPLTVTVTGERYYGGNMAPFIVSISGGAISNIPNIDTLPKGVYNVDVSGVKNVNGDSKDNIFDQNAFQMGKLATVDNDAGSSTTVGSHTNVGSYTKDTTVAFNLDNTNAINTANIILSNHNYYVKANGTNTVKIVPKPITLTTTGSKTYDGTATDPTTVDMTQSGMADWDVTAGLLSNNKATWLGTVTKPNAVSAAGSYGTEGSATNAYKTTGYFTYTDANKTIIQNTLSNYAVSYKDKYDIGGKTLKLSIAGTRDYGSAMGTGGIDEATFTYDGLVDDADKAIFATNKNAWYNYYADASNVSTTHAGTYGTEGATGNAYKTSGAIVMDDTEKGNVSTALGNNYIITYTDLLTVKPVSLTINVNGERTYGDSMNNTTYNTSTGATIPATINNKTWNVNLNGLVNGDTAATALNKTGMQALLKNIESGEGTATTTLGTHTNARETAYVLNGTDLTGTTLTIAGKENDLLTSYQTGSRDYTISIASNSNNTVKIDTKAVVVTTKGSKIYGNTDPNLTKDAVTESGLTAWDATSYFTDSNRTTWAGQAANSTDEASSAGLYGTVNVGKTGYKSSPVLTYTTDQQTAIQNTFNNNGTTSNYAVTFADDFTINKRQLTITTSGTKVYGDANPAASALTIAADAATADTGLVTANGDNTTFANKVAGTDWKNLVDDKATTATHAGTYGTKGTTSTAVTLLYDDTDKGTISTDMGNNYDITYNDLFTVTKAPLTVTVTGERQYGGTMGTSTYTTDASNTSNTQGIYNVKVEGIKGVNGDTVATVLNGIGVKNTLSGIEGAYSEGATKINPHTDANSIPYNIKDGTAYTGSNINLVNDIGSTNAILTSTDYYVAANGDHTLKIVPKEITITTSGSKTYGAEDPDTSKYTIGENGLTSWDKTNLYGTDGSSWKSGITNSTTKTTDKGVYGTKSTDAELAHHTQVLSYAPDSKLVTDLATNYNVTYDDAFTIGITKLIITITGSKTYSDATDLTLSKYNISSVGLENTDTLNYTGLENSVALYDNAGTYSKGNGTDTTNGITGLTGLSGFNKENYDITYKTTYTVNPKDLLLTTNGSRIYGNENSTINYANIADTNGAIVNPADVTTFNNYQATLKGAVQVANTISKTTDAGTYGTKGTTSNIATLTYTDGQKTATAAQFNNNYNITYADQLTITPRPLHYTITGTQIYGQTPGTTGDKYTITPKSGVDSEGLVDSQNLDSSKLTVINGVTSTTDVNIDGYKNTGTTPLGVTAVTGFAGAGTNGFKASNYNISMDTSNYTVTPADLVIHITGSKTYGDTTSTSGKDYTYNTTGATGGLQNGETINYNTATVNHTGLAEQANAGSYYKNYAGKADTTGNTIDDMGNLTGTGNFKTTNYNISYVTDYTINPKALTITTTGTKVYGNADPDTSSYDMQQSGLTSWDESKLSADLKDNITNSTDEQTDAGKYGTQNGSTQVLSYGDAITNKLNHNYAITYVDNFTITKRPITHSYEGTKEYGTGGERTSYKDNGFTNLPDFATITETPAVTNSSNRTTAVGDYNNSLLGVTFSGSWLKNYDLTETTVLHVTPADFTYTADDTSYWRGMNIPPQSGKVTNRYGEDVSDLVGNRNWETPANNTTPAGKYHIYGYGANDNSGNYKPLQAPGNDTALTIKEGQEGPEKRTLIPGGWGPVRRPLLDIRYLYIEGTQGINRWGDVAYSITGGDNHKAAGVDTLSGMGLASSQGYIPAQGTGVGTFYSKDKDKAYRF